MQMLIKYPDNNIIQCTANVRKWLGVGHYPGINKRKIKFLPQNREIVWDWEEVFSNPFTKAKQIYFSSKLGSLLLVSMLDEYNNDTSTPLGQTLLVLYNDYHLSCIISYI